MKTGHRFRIEDEFKLLGTHWLCGSLEAKDGMLTFELN